VEAPVGNEHGGQAKQDEGSVADRIFKPERCEISLALEYGVGQIGGVDDRQQSEEPATARQEIVLVAFIFGDVVRKKQAAQQEEQAAIGEHEDIDLEGQAFQLLQAELEPPEMQHEQE
jgi:hypothetical protein